MHKMLALLGSMALAAMTAAAASAQGTVKVGVIMPYSGQFADLSAQMDNGIKLYMKQNGDTVAGKKIEIIRRDTGGVAPDVATRLAQELVTRDNVDILAGFTLSPNAIAVSKISAEAKKFMVIMNAATTVIITMSPYSVRTSMTLPSVGASAGMWAYKSGLRKAYTMVSDFAPGKDAEAAFQDAFKKAGGEIVGAVRMPVANPDFSAFVQRAKDLSPESIFIFVPGGAQPAALGKAFAERGIDPNKIKIIGTGEISDESAVKNMGDAALGIITAWHYDHTHDSKPNKDFVAAYNAEFKRNPDFGAVGGYDGMHVIYESLKKTGGKADADSLVAAAKGLKWESPRGPFQVDPETRDVVQTIYVRQVRKVGDQLLNVEFDKMENVRDPGSAGKK
ncbi:MAG: ABC transporter substrate-binding protein [Hyphomonadaceae bacterium]|jgi:branched-chain amino acid transport system substrate-binding protein|nr:ABC transporter substrate-binding protein [Hyphomonadaceae bacterium]